jgi:uncharacterized membrane protein
MTDTLAIWLVDAATLYLLLGCCFAIPFILVGVHRLDPAIRVTGGFRLVVLPGCALLWPLLARRWLAARRREVP